MNNRLSQKITARFLIRFSFPSIVMMVVMSLYTVVDGAFVSRLIGTDAFSAVNIVYPLLSLTIGLGTMFGTGITAIVARKSGEGKRDEANANLTFILLVTVLLGVLLSVICLLVLKPVLYLLGSNDSIFPYCYDYAYPLVFFFTANMLQCQFQNLYVANGKPQIGLIMTTIGGLANIVLDYFFIADCGMGIAGAAIATGIGYSIPAVFGIFYFWRNKSGALRFMKPKIDWQVLWRTITNGSSEMVSYLSGSITTFLFNIIMMRLMGQDGVASIAILLYMDFILIAISLGYSIGIAPLISYNYGCGNHSNLKRLFRLSALFCLLIGLVMAVGTIILSHPLTQIFTAKGTDVYNLTVAGLKIYAIGYLFKGYNIFVSAMFTAYGNGKVSAILSFMRTLLFLVSALVGLSALFGITGVWYATPLAEFLACAFSVLFTAKYGKVYFYS